MGLKAAVKGIAPAPLWALVRKWHQAYLDFMDARGRAQARRRAVEFYLRPQWRLALDWARHDKETANFYYDLNGVNRQHLAHFVCAVTGAAYEVALGYIEELRRDKELLAYLQAEITKVYPQKEIEVAFGRRLGWYAIARILKPRVIAETGVDHGVGACVLCRALARNAEDGHAGRYFGFDLNPSAGGLVKGSYAEMGSIIYGDSIEQLGKFAHPIDLFINDSDHSEDFEEREYAALAPLLSPGATVLSDNSHATDALGRFARARGLNFLFFREQPKDHWYPGAGIGAAFPDRAAGERAGRVKA